MNLWALLCAVTSKQFQQFTDEVMRFERMPQPLIGVNHVVIPPPFLPQSQIPRTDQFSNNPLNHPLGNSHESGNIAEANRWVAIDAIHYMRMIRKKRPSQRSRG